MSTTPRRPLVPGPSAENSIAQRAIAVREQQVPRIDGEPSIPMQRSMRQHGPAGKLAAAIAAVMSELGVVPKGGENKYYGYKYPRMEDVLAILTPLMGKHGLAVFQDEIEVKTVEKSVAVVYEFTIVHSSGESWGPMRRTGTSLARDSKGGWDDKALNKCQTQANKNFLLKQFQIPTDDIPDNDADGSQKASDANQRRGRAPVPGPKAQPAPEEPAPDEWHAPQKIGLGAGAGPDVWVTRFIREIGHAKTTDEVNAWDKLNEKTLQHISDNYPASYDMISIAVQRRLDDLGGGDRDPTLGMPDPKADSQEAMNWVASQLQQFKDYQAGEEFWNQQVAPHEKEFDTVDWDMLIAEWQRFETRFPQADPPPEAA